MIRNDNISHTHTHTHTLTRAYLSGKELIERDEKQTDLRERMRKEEREGEQECLGGNNKKKNIL